MEPVRPALKEPVIAYLASYAAILAVASLITLPVPSPIRIPLVLLVGIVTAVPVGLGIWKAVYSHFTEQYLVDGGEVTIRRGFVTKTGADIPSATSQGSWSSSPSPSGSLASGRWRFAPTTAACTCSTTSRTLPPSPRRSGRRWLGESQQ